MYSDYYIWLNSLVQDGNHEQLVRYLYEQEYRWQFVLDENRAAGGLNLRERYSYEAGVNLSDIGTAPCSVLEMLIGLASRMTEILSMDIRDWFWDLMRNLGLDRFDDHHFDERGVNYILSVWLDRQYDAHGNGSLFPVREYSGDCRTLDIWAQMNIWIEENFPHNDDWL